MIAEKGPNTFNIFSFLVRFQQSTEGVMNNALGLYVFVVIVLAAAMVVTIVMTEE